jgi:predicted permease
MTYGFPRRLWHRPWLSLTVVGTIGCGIALNVAVFTVINAVLLRPLPFPGADRLVVLGSSRAEQPGALRTMSLNDLGDVAAGSKSYEAVGAWRDWSFRLRTPNGVRGVYASIVTPGFFEALPVKPVLGRVFGPGEDRAGQNLRVLISERLWREEFHADGSIIGRTVTLSRAPMGDAVFTIVGVLPADIGWPPAADTQVWALSSIDEDAGLRRDVRNRRVVARLRSGVSLDAANAELAVMARALAGAYPATNAGWTVRAVPAVESLLGPTRNLLLAFLIAVGCVALIACANVAGVLLADTAGRRREFAVRLAIGATRRRIVGTVLGESLALSAIAGAVSLLLAGWLVRGILALAPGIPRADQSAFDWRVALFAAALSLVCGAAFGILPALRETRADVTDALRADRSGSAGARSSSLRSWLVTGQIAIALVLVVAAAAASATVVTLLRSDPGFEPHGLVAFFLTPAYDRYPKGESIASAYRRVQDELGSLPGVRSAASVSAVGPLLGGQEDVVYQLPGDPPTGVRRSAFYYNVTPGYFATLGIPLREGRDLSWQDTPGAEPVAVVNDTFAAQSFPGTSALGRRVNADGQALTIVGVTAGGVRGVTPGAIAQPEIYYPYSQRPRWMTIVVLRIEGDLAPLAPAIRQRLRRIDADFAPMQMMPLTERIARARQGPAFVASVFGVFAFCALLLSVVGVYGLVAYTLAQRTREIGIRISLGASAREILLVTLGGASRAVLAGAATGVLGALLARRVLAAALPAVGQVDTVQLVLVTAVLILAGIGAAYLPARRALAIDPARTLRDQ